MQYRTSIVVQPAITHLVTVLAEWLPLEVDADAVAQLVAQAGAGPKHYRLSASGHVVVRVELDGKKPGSAWLQLDGNRRNIATAREIVQAYEAVFGSGAVADEDVALEEFRARLAEIE